MTSVTLRLQQLLDARPAGPADPRASTAARRILLIASVVSAATLLLALAGLIADPRTIGGAPAWVKPAKFGVSITLSLITLRWMIGAVHGHRRLLTVLAVALAAAFALETLWIDVQVIRGTTSHFNAATAFDADAFNAAGGVVSVIFLAIVAVGILALRTRGLDAGVAAGIRWGLAVCTLGMLEAVSMLVNGSTATTRGAHTVGAPDGGPGLPVTDWSLAHGDLRIGHFIGLHALQVLPLIAWALLRFTPLGAIARRDLVRVAGLGAAGVVVFAWWQAERGQALLRPDLLTLVGAAALCVALAAAAGLVLRRALSTSALPRAPRPDAAPVRSARARRPLPIALEIGGASSGRSLRSGSGTTLAATEGVLDG